MDKVFIASENIKMGEVVFVNDNGQIAKVKSDKPKETRPKPEGPPLKTINVFGQEIK